MIIWIASYPRSGNSLLRQILYYSMGKVSHTEGTAEIEVEAEYSRPIPPNSSGFYGSARAASDPIFIKTHSLPTDDQPALYVVRDGRAAIASFLKFERHFSPASRSNTMLQLILGDHHYGSWSQHYHAWHQRQHGATLTLRYDELFGASDDVLAKIASFIGYDGPIAPWENPIDEYRRRYPAFVGQGRLEWTPTDEWDFLSDAVFWDLHGELMNDLGLDDGCRVAAPPGVDAEKVLQLIPLMKHWVGERRAFERACAEKEAVIQKQHAAVEELRRELEVQAKAAEERRQALEALQHVHTTSLAGLTRERDVQAEVAAERLVTIERQQREFTHALEELARERGSQTEVGSPSTSDD